MGAVPHTGAFTSLSGRGVELGSTPSLSLPHTCMRTLPYMHGQCRMFLVNGVWDETARMKSHDVIMLRVT